MNRLSLDLFPSRPFASTSIVVFFSFFIFLIVSEDIHARSGLLIFSVLLFLVLDDKVEHGAATVRPSAKMKGDAFRRYFDESCRFRYYRLRSLRARVQNV